MPILTEEEGVGLLGKNTFKYLVGLSDVSLEFIGGNDGNRVGFPLLLLDEGLDVGFFEGLALDGDGSSSSSPLPLLLLFVVGGGGATVGGSVGGFSELPMGDFVGESLDC